MYKTCINQHCFERREGNRFSGIHTYLRSTLPLKDSFKTWRTQERIHLDPFSLRSDRYCSRMNTGAILKGTDTKRVCMDMSSYNVQHRGQAPITCARIKNKPRFISVLLWIESKRSHKSHMDQIQTSTVLLCSPALVWVAEPNKMGHR